MVRDLASLSKSSFRSVPAAGNVVTAASRAKLSRRMRGLVILTFRPMSPCHHIARLNLAHQRQQSVPLAVAELGVASATHAVRIGGFGEAMIADSLFGDGMPDSPPNLTFVPQISPSRHGHAGTLWNRPKVFGSDDLSLLMQELQLLLAFSTRSTVFMVRSSSSSLSPSKVTLLICGVCWFAALLHRSSNPKSTSAIPVAVCARKPRW